MLIAPSILSADFANLAKDVEMVNQSEADWFHIDVMDGVFVPNISFGFPVIKAIQKYARKPLDVHLMIVDPDRYIGAVRDCGAEIMNIHQEASTHLHRSLQAIKAAGMKAGVTLNPATPLVMIEEVIEDADVIMLMGVNPGFGGQSFINATVDKMRRLREMVDKLDNPPLLEIDGGVNATTAPLLRDAGADVLVAGSYVFSSPDPTDTIKKLKQL
ncbi:MAG: ribulose-phosphate 3-epimerase [Muribaculaceae bacterium]|nr:ribulose-phosphate 3-epimerase [Muribaculaceae bacterium]